MEVSITDFKKIEDLIFLQKGEQLYIGGELVDNKKRSLLRDEARRIQTTDLYAIFDSTIINEAANLALIQSGKSGSIEDDVRSAKMLYHWNHVLRNMVHALAK